MISQYLTHISIFLIVFHLVPSYHFTPCVSTPATFPCALTNRVDLYQHSYAGTKRIEHSYYYMYYTGLHLDPLLDIVDDMIKAHQAGTADVDNVHKCAECVYSSVISVLNSLLDCVSQNVTKSFLSFPWSEELSLPTEPSIESNNLWKAAGKPRCGSTFVSRQSSRLACRKNLRECQCMEWTPSLTPMICMKPYYIRIELGFGNDGSPCLK